MGGSALGIETLRLNKDKYVILRDRLLHSLRDIFIDVRFEEIPAYRDKASFGDIDILMESNNLPNNWVELISSNFSPKSTFKNGAVFSFEYEMFQVDLILADRSVYTNALVYLSWNDLGNLMGRVSNRLGFKYGHKGLFYPRKNLQGNYTSRVLVTTDVPSIFSFLDYDLDRHRYGFDKLTEMFEYAMSSEYFDKNIFLDGPQTHRERARYKKRPSYIKFAEHVRSIEDSLSGLTDVEVLALKESLLSRALSIFPDFSARMELVALEEDIKHRAISIFNATIVSDITGAQGKDLGVIMANINKQFPSKMDMYKFFLDMDESDVISYVKSMSI